MPEPTVTCSAHHKKKAGMLSILEEETPPKIVWKCIDSSISPVDLPLAKIHKMQATNPEKSSKILLKLMLFPEGVAEDAEVPADVKGPELLFRFTNPESMNEVKSILQQVLARRRTEQSAKLAGGGPILTQSADSSNGNGNNSNSNNNNLNVENDEFLANLLDSEKLLNNLPLQEKLLAENPKLRKTFADAVMISRLDPKEFWSTRLHLLRSYALQNNQKRGPYNVLSTIKPVASSDNKVNVSVTREKIHEIFRQYPLVRKAYDDTVPKISEGEFWSRFFSSKLFRKLRGEKVNLHDRGDTKLDKYLYYDPDYDGEEEDEDIDKLLEDNQEKGKKKKDEQPPSLSSSASAGSQGSTEADKTKKGKRKRKQQQQESAGEGLSLTSAKKRVKLFNETGQDVSKFIDIAANDQDNSQRYGNKPDITMKLDQDPDLVGIMRSMNRLSRRMMSTIKEDSTVDLDKEFEKELEIKDLEDIEDVEYNELKYTQKSNISSSIIPNEVVEKTGLSPLNPTSNPYDDIASMFKKELNVKLNLSIFYHEKKQNQEAYKDVNSILKRSSNQSSQAFNQLNLDSAVNQEEPEINYLSNDKLENLRLTHSTSVEFLKHFWMHYNSVSTSSLSTNPKFKSELITLKGLYFSVKKCIERIDANMVDLGDQEKEIAVAVMNPLTESLTSALKSYESAIVGSSSS